MVANLLQRFFSIFRSKPDPELIADQLRKPSGKLADKVAAKMDQVNAPLFDLTLEALQLEDNDTVLEIGFGSGKYFGKMFDKADQLAISGVDYSQKMVESAATHNQPALKSGKLTLKRANSKDLPFPDEYFDKVFCNMVIYFWDQPKDHLQEIHRILKPSGRFYTGIRAKESMMRLPFIQHGFNLYDKGQWMSILSEHGFNVTKVLEKLDPATEIEGEEMHMQSICIIAEKTE